MESGNADASRGSVPSLVDEDPDQEPSTTTTAQMPKKKKKGKKVKKKPAAEEQESTPLEGSSPLDGSTPPEESPKAARKKKKSKNRPSSGATRDNADEVDTDQEGAVDHPSETALKGRPRKKTKKKSLEKEQDLSRLEATPSRVAVPEQSDDTVGRQDLSPNALLVKKG